MEHRGSQLSRRPPGRPSVTLTRRGPTLLLPRQCPEVERALLAVQRLAVPDRQHGCRVESRWFSLLRRSGTDAGDHGWCLAGFEPVLARALWAQGVAVRLDGFVPLPLPAPADPLVPPELPPDPAVLALVRRVDRGLVRYRRGAVDLGWLVAQVARAWPTLRVAVVVRRHEDAAHLRDRVGRWLPDVTVSTGRSRVASPGRVAVVTEEYLDSYEVQRGGRDVVIAADALEALSRRCQEALFKSGNARLYGLLPSDATVAPLDEAMLRGWFSFNEVAVAGHGRVERPVEVLTVPVPARSAVPAEANALERKRATVWHRADRNELVARLARQLVASSEPMGDDEAAPLATAPANHQARQVLVLAESLEHAAALIPLLPECPLVAGPHRQAEHLGEAVSRALARGVGWRVYGGERLLVATFAGLADTAPADVDVVLRADAGVGLPPFDAGSIEFNGNTPPLLLVDLADEHDERLRHSHRSRTAAYAARGWLPAGCDPVQTRVERFLNRRPGRER